MLVSLVDRDAEVLRQGVSELAFISINASG
jgi:hypothetical protein